jgi:hypothetical protein
MHKLNIKKDIQWYNNYNYNPPCEQELSYEKNLDIQ